MQRAHRIHLGPEQDPFLERAIISGGAVLSPLVEADALVWSAGPEHFPTELPDRIRWIQLPAAGIEPWLKSGLIDDTRIWTSAAGAYADNVAEHAVLLLLAGTRGLTGQIRSATWRKAYFDSQVHSIRGSTVAVIGCGGIGRALIPHLHSLSANVIAVNRSGRPVEGAHDTVPSSRVSEVWAQADHLVLAAPATAETRHLVDESVLAAMSAHSWIVNVARGSLIDTDALVSALQARTIGGAALDVTEPEPLPDNHPLWTMNNALITPHVANPATNLGSVLAQRVQDNVMRFTRGIELLAAIDTRRGY